MFTIQTGQSRIPYIQDMAELVDQILALPQDERLKIAMRILLSIQEENDPDPSWHLDRLEEHHRKVEEGKVSYHSEAEFWKAVRKRIS